MEKQIISNSLLNSLLEYFSKYEIYNYIATYGIDETEPIENLNVKISTYVTNEMPENTFLCPKCGEVMESDYDYNTGLLNHICSDCGYIYSE